MALEQNERLQEFVLVAGDKVSMVDRRLWYALLITIVAAAPVYFLAKTSFVKLAMVNYKAPVVVKGSAPTQPLEVVSKGIFDLGNNNYSAYVKVWNKEYDWGMANQEYVAEFKTLGGTSVTKVNGSAFILPSREKLIVFSRFNSPQKPDQLVFTLGQPHYIRRPQLEFNHEMERLNLNNTGSSLVVSAGIKNLTPFTVKQVNLPVAVYNTNNEIVAVNFTYINDLLSGETRTFQYSWPGRVTGANRAEITPEVNVFDPNVFQVAPGVSPF